MGIAYLLGRFSDDETIASFSSTVIAQGVLSNVYSIASNSDELSDLNNIMNTNVSSLAWIQRYEQICINNPKNITVDSPIADATAWHGNMSAVLDLWHTVEYKYMIDINGDVSAAKNDAIFNICMYLITTTIGVIVSIGLSMFFAQTIIGPWVRLNIAQENTIAKSKKFVPYDILRILHYSTITDVELGVTNKKELCVMFVDVVSAISTFY
jgi:hypothetical protein